MTDTEKTNDVRNGEMLIHSFNSTDYSQGNFEGLTKREHFAGLAMQGYLASNNGQTSQYLAERSVKAADELLKALEK